MFFFCVVGVVAFGAAAYLFAPDFRAYNEQVRALAALDAPARANAYHSRLYSAAFALTSGMACTREDFLAELDARDYLLVPRGSLEPGQFRPTREGILVYLRGYRLPGASGPDGQIVLQFRNNRILNLTPLVGTPAAQSFSLEPILLAELLGSPPRRSTYTPISRIPRALSNAVVASEDSRFFDHHGLDFRGIMRAAKRNIQAGGVVEGGSTITQQLARSLFLTRSRTFRRKFSELTIAILLDQYLSKDELLELYLNTVYLGQQDGVAIHGVTEAARSYFNKPIEALGLAESATLSAIIPAPNAYSPFRNPDRALARRNTVLELMAAQGRISADDARDAQNAPLEVAPGQAVPLKYGYYSGYVRSRLASLLGEDYELRGLTIYSALDPVIQDRVQRSVEREVKELENQFGRRAEPLQGAAFIMDHQTARVLAIVGGRGYTGNPYNRAFQALRQPGSAFKSFAYAAALEPEEGASLLTPCSTVSNERRTFQVKEGDWRPRNYEQDYYASVSLAKALAKSLNVATVNLVDQIRPERVARLGEKLGMPNLKPVLSIGLGTSEVSLERLTAAYAVFPAGGKKVDPAPFEKVVDPLGRAVLLATPPSEQLISPTTAALMVELLRSVVVYGTAWRLRTEGYFTAPSAGKTGTTQDEQDAWYVGFTPQYIMGVWFGYDNPTHMYGSAADIAVPAWGRIMTDFLQGRPSRDFELPDDLHYVWIDPYSGGIGTARCPRTMRVAVIKGTEPTFSCPLLHEDEPEEEEGMDAGEDGADGGDDGLDEGEKPEGGASGGKQPPPGEVAGDPKKAAVRAPSTGPKRTPEAATGAGRTTVPAPGADKGKVVTLSPP